MTDTSAVPSPAELSVWLDVAAPRTATGSFRWSGSQERFGWGYAGDPPAFAIPEKDVPVAFRYAAPDRWWLEQAGQVLAVHDGTQAVGVGPEGVTLGSWLMVLPGPADLLRPQMRGGRRFGEPIDDGRVQLDDRLGRRCWQWDRGSETWWVDHETGAALAMQTDGLLLELTDVAFDVALDPASFRVPTDLLSRAQPTQSSDDYGDEQDVRSVDLYEHPSGNEDDERDRRCGFTVPYWPRGALTFPQKGDAAVPEMLLALTGDGEERFWLGVAPEGRSAPTRRAATVERWSGDGWEFALSYRGSLDAADLARIVASVPRRWEL